MERNSQPFPLFSPLTWKSAGINSWLTAAAAAAKSLQLCPTLCDPINGSPPGSPVPGILKARTLEWVAISFSNARKWKVKGKSLSHVRLLATPWTAAFQAPLVDSLMTLQRKNIYLPKHSPSLYRANRKKSVQAEGGVSSCFSTMADLEVEWDSARVKT